MDAVSCPYLGLFMSVLCVCNSLTFMCSHLAVSEVEGETIFIGQSQLVRGVVLRDRKSKRIINCCPSADPQEVSGLISAPLSMSSCLARVCRHSARAKLLRACCPLVTNSSSVFVILFRPWSHHVTSSHCDLDV